jgi:ABC-type oligopeptide transport system substrate-binding subunit
MKNPTLFKSISLVLAALLITLGLSLSACGDTATTEDAQETKEHPTDGSEHPEEGDEHPKDGSEHPKE